MPQPSPRTRARTTIDTSFSPQAGAQDAAPLGPQPRGSGPQTGAARGGLAPTPLPPRSWWELRPPRGPHHPPAQDRERPIPVPIPAPTAALRHRPAAGSRPRSRGCCYRPSFPPKNSPPHRGAQPWAESVAKTLRLGPDLPPPAPEDHPAGCPLPACGAGGAGAAGPRRWHRALPRCWTPASRRAKGSRGRRGGGAAACASPSAPRRGGS